MRAIPIRAGTCGRWSGGCAPAFEQGAELGLEGDIGCIDHLSAGDDNDVEPTGRFVVAKQLTCQAFGSVPDHGRPYLAGGRDAQSRRGRAVLPHEEDHQPAREAPAGVVDVLEILSDPDVLVGPESSHQPSGADQRFPSTKQRPRGAVIGRSYGTAALGNRPGIPLAFVRDRQALPPLGAPTLEHLPAVLGRHPDEKAVLLDAAAVIGLERALALLRSGHIFPRNEPPMVCPSNRACKGLPACYSVRSPLTPSGQVFHTCGKTCGKDQGTTGKAVAFHVPAGVDHPALPEPSCPPRPSGTRF
jgi:hypothetical protein